MKIIYVIAIICLFTLPSCGQTHNAKMEKKSIKHKHTNKLINESSPYLLQHAHNPVNWSPWGKEALAKAKKENKLIIISVGYAACHWCHVMEHESFEDEAVAQYMNDNFVCIKVDREERPDIDQIYMNAVQLLTGRGGWPLNCIALPDGRPIYGGTYFPKGKWLDVLSQVSKFVKDKPDKAEQQAKQLTEGVRSSETIVANTQKPSFTIKDLNSTFSNWKSKMDFKEGGNGKAPKFPMPIGYDFLLHYNYLTDNTKALKSTTLTLDKMAAGGIYDQVGGGFSRYSTDAIWKAPHFEKMLYDNAQLVSLYSKAYQKTKDPNYKRVVEESLVFIKRELSAKKGGFYSSLDADSEGEEGKFYVWTKEELKKLLDKDAELISDYYEATEKGNWEHGRNILFKRTSDVAFAKKNNLSEVELSKKVARAKKVLLKERTNRIRPGLDDKIITAWNALMIKGYTDAYRAFGNKDYLKTAIKNAEFINAKLKQSDNRLYRNFKNNKASINSFLDDYAFTIEAFIALYQATFNERWLLQAKELNEYTIAHFYNKKSGMFYYTSDIDPALIARKMEILDNVIPASNSQMAKNLYILGHYFGNESYLSKAKQMLNNVKNDAIKGGQYYANWNILMAWFASPPYEVAILGNDFEAKRKELDQNYLPNVFLSGGKKEGSLELHEFKLVKGQTTIYVCQNKSCQKPVTNVAKALGQIAK